MDSVDSSADQLQQSLDLANKLTLSTASSSPASSMATCRPVEASLEVKIRNIENKRVLNDRLTKNAKVN
jgi:hypothetical protein